VAFAQIDVLILSVIASQELVGQYASVSRLLLVTGFLAVVAWSAVLPTASRFFTRSDPERFGEVVSEALRFVLLGGGGVVVAIFLVAKELLGLVYGSDFEPLAPLLRWGSIFVAFKFSTSVCSIMLTACGRQGLRARAIVIGLVATAALVIGLVPIWGLAGAVVALVLSEVVVVVLQVWSLWDYLRTGLLLRTTASLLLALVGAMVAFLLLSRAGQPLWILLVVPSLTYVVIVLVSGEATRAFEFLRRQRS
jgi:O-antigen/teichoic acid export membrane protein